MTTYTDSWTEDGELTEDAGDVGGDVQASESYNRRFICQPDPDKAEFHVLDFYGYSAIDNPNGDVNDPTEPRGIQIQVRYSVCTDPTDPGGSEISTGYRYWDHQEDSKTLTPLDRITGLTREDLDEATNQMSSGYRV